jgi:hypothetical protein
MSDRVDMLNALGEGIVRNEPNERKQEISFHNELPEQPRPPFVHEGQLLFHGFADRGVLRHEVLNFREHRVA